MTTAAAAVVTDAVAVIDRAQYEFAVSHFLRLFYKQDFFIVCPIVIQLLPFKYVICSLNAKRGRNDCLFLFHFLLVSK